MYVHVCTYLHAMMEAVLCIHQESLLIEGTSALRDIVVTYVFTSCVASIQRVHDTLTQTLDGPDCTIVFVYI